MKHNIIKISIIIFSLFANMANSQNVTLDYSTFSSSACNIFSAPVNFNGITHQTTIGNPQYNSSTHAIVMNFDYAGGGGQKGTEFKIGYNIKQDYTYTIKVTGRNVGNYTTPTGLRISFGDNGSNSLCNGVSLITGTTTGNSLTNALQFQSTSFNEDVWYFNVGITSPSSYIRFATFSDFIANPQLQAIEIKKIEIIEISPPASFSLSPTTVAVPCNSTSPVTFAVTNVYNSPGTLTYNWVVSSGWSGTYNSSMSSITLTPTAYPPGTVNVTTIYNGVAQPTKTCSVSLSPFTSSATITGVTGICSGSTPYAISNITSGQTVTWSLSNSSIGSLSNLSNSGATVTFTGNGAQTLNALITNQCGQTTTKTYQINNGATTFTSAAVISGSSSFCTGSNLYTLSGLLAGQSVSWSLSDTAIANLSGSTNTQTTVNFTGSGSQTLSAVITNSCGQTATKTFQIYGGVPTLSNFTCGEGAPFCDGYVCICDSCLPSFDFSSLLMANMNGQTSSESNVTTNWQWAKLNNKIQITTNKGKKCYIAANVLGSTGVQVRAKNSCGWSQWYTINFDVVSCARMTNTNPNIYTISPNPAKDIVNIELKEKNKNSLKAAIISGELFDLLGISKSKIEIKDNTATFSVAGLIKGVYVLKIYINDQVESHEIAVE